MKSREKLQVTAKPNDQFGGKYWVLVELLLGGPPRSWIPSLEDLYRIVQAICFCEDLKYPHGKGRELVREFLSKCCDDFGVGVDCIDGGWQQIKTKFQIPDREGNDDEQ